MSASLTRKLKQAQERLEQGDPAGGQFLCEEILRQAPRNPDALWLLAMAHLMGGQVAAGIPLLEQVVAIAPRHGAALENLGLARLMVGRYAEAEHVLRQAAKLAGAPPSVWMRLGVALLRQDRAEEAIVELERALARNPADVDARMNLGQAHARLGRHDAAAAAFTAVLAHAPRHADAMFNLGVLDIERDALTQAQSWFEQALAVAPDHVEALVNASIVLRRQQRHDEALQYVERALRTAPGNAAALDNLGQALRAAGRHAEAREAFLAALRADSSRLSAREGLAYACFALHRYGEAVPHLREILRIEAKDQAALEALAHALFQCGELDEARLTAGQANAAYPDAVAAYSVLAQVHVVQGRLEEAVGVLETGHARTRSPQLLGLLTHQLRRLCDWDRWHGAWQRMHALLPETTDLGSPFNLLCETTTAQEQLDYTRRWAQARFASYAALPPTARTRGGNDRLRIGYLSPDFYEHPVGYLLAEVLESHDRDRYEIYAYSHGPDDGGPTRARYEAAAEHFVDISRMPDDLAYERIRDDELDLLVDLHGYTVGDRLEIMARRPCPVQATWLGYPGTTGASFIDYLIADPFVIPPGEESRYASERVVRLPGCYQPNDRKRPRVQPLTRIEYGLPDSGFVFCCFNQLFKITPEVYACWMRLLRDIPGSVLWLMHDHGAAVTRLRAVAAAHGVDADRVVFAPRIALVEHLARYGVADLALDTFPYTSHTTSSDALWGDCPLVALCGDTFAARVSGSILTQAGLPDLITHDLDAYCELARRLATNAGELREVRARVVAAKSDSRLFDTVRFTRDLETLYARLVASTA